MGWTKTEVARRFGIHWHTVHKAVLAGRVKLDDDGTINEQSALERWGHDLQDRTAERRGYKTDGSENLKLERERIELEIAKIKLAKMQGSLVPVEQAKQECLFVLHALRGKLKMFKAQFMSLARPDMSIEEIGEKGQEILIALVDDAIRDIEEKAKSWGKSE